MDNDPGVELEKIRIGIWARAHGLRQRAGAGEGADAEAQDQGARRRQETAARDGRVGALQRVFDGLRKLEWGAHPATSASLGAPWTTRLIAA
jgi:hypothetical protein